MMSPSVVSSVLAIRSVSSFPPSLSSFPVVPSNSAMRESVTDVGPITAPSRLTCAITQFAPTPACVPLAVLSVMQ
jgi:hypothetical protein